MIGTTNLPPNVTPETLTHIVRMFDAFAKTAVVTKHDMGMRKIIKRGHKAGLSNFFCFIIDDVTYAGQARIQWEHTSASIIRVKSFQVEHIDTHVDGMDYTARDWNCFQNVRNELY